MIKSLCNICFRPIKEENQWLTHQRIHEEESRATELCKLGLIIPRNNIDILIGCKEELDTL